jgi:hypothetical protein
MTAHVPYLYKHHWQIELVDLENDKVIIGGPL